MCLTSNQTCGGDKPTLQGVREVHLSDVPQQNRRYILFTLVDATTKPIFFGGKVTNRLTGRNTTGSTRRCSASSSSKDGSDSDDGALMHDTEKLALAALWRLNANQEIVQDHLGYALGEVSLRDAAS